MKKIAISLGIIGVVAAIVIGATTAFFSDTETSIGNTFTAGVIDISVNGDNPWTKTFALNDMKPSQTDYINFTIENKGSGANPVNVWKKITVTKEETGVVSEPECTDQEGTWTSGQCTWKSEHPDNNNISSVIEYDLSVEVYNAAENKIWWQTIYNKDVTVAGINGQSIFLGMVPADGFMKVTQSYHMKGQETGNWAQGDIMTFGIEVKGEQLTGSLVLENKSGEPDWQIKGGDNMKGNLAYNVKGPKFDYTFSASGLKASTDYRLIYYADPWDGDNPGALIASFMTDESGNIVATTGSVDLGMDLPKSPDANYPAGAKIWLVTANDYNGGSASVGPMTAWNLADYLFETALITYDDTDL